MTVRSIVQVTNMKEKSEGVSEKPEVIFAARGLNGGA